MTAMSTESIHLQLSLEGGGRAIETASQTACDGPCDHWRRIVHHEYLIRALVEAVQDGCKQLLGRFQMAKFAREEHGLKAGADLRKERWHRVAQDGPVVGEQPSPHTAPQRIHKGEHGEIWLEGEGP